MSECEGVLQTLLVRFARMYLAFAARLANTCALAQACLAVQCSVQHRRREPGEIVQGPIAEITFDSMTLEQVIGPTNERVGRRLETEIHVF